ncbi:MAG: DUF1553 domain-containing protein [Cyclobacteriaceae bacterium]
MPAFLKYLFFFFAILYLNGCRKIEIPEEVAEAKKKLPDYIDFNIHVKPILSDRCFSCHGPDKNKREAELRLDISAVAFAKLKSGNGKAIIPGDPDNSELSHRILSSDEEYRMPPAISNLYLNADEKATLIKWIEQGATYKPHWAFIPPEQPEIPEIADKNQLVRNQIDNFILATLEKKGLEQSPQADKERLLRRVTLDLTGLPPTIEEIDSFLADDSPGAYEKVVDRLMQTDAYAERLALEWMDVARYADSHGMHADGWRYMWPWRDWVIESFKNNMPYDQFATWQLAGDLIPNATKQQILATAFNRNHPMTAEGGVIEEEFRLLNVFDRANTTGIAFMGLQLECAKCHDHKFDPISQKNYYQMAAFFNNIKELGMTGDDGNYGPMVLLSDLETDEKLIDLEQKIKKSEEQIKFSDAKIANIVGFINKAGKSEMSVGLLSYLPFDKMDSVRGKNEWAIDGNPDCTTTGTPQLADGKFNNALEFNDGYDEVYLKNVGDFEMTDAFSVSLWINTTKKEKGKTQVLIGNSSEKDTGWRGWDFFLDSLNQLSVRLIHSLPHNYIHVAGGGIRLNTWTHVAFTYDGSGKASGLSLFVNGKKTKPTIHYDRLYKSIKSIHKNGKPADMPLTIGKSNRRFTGDIGIFQGRLDEIRIFSTRLTSLETARIAGEERVITEEIRKEHYRSKERELQKSVLQLTELRNEKLKLVNGIPELMVMEEMPEPRLMFVLDRGQYDAPTERVEAGTPESISIFPDSLPKNRLGLSRWLFSKNHPLTARVTVNRYWQMIFGKGLVKTSEDFGNQGSLPTHPELLNWLAVSFQQSGWDLKKLLKLMVMSATYRQSSATDQKQQTRDSENLWLARGPSHRLQAELIRDNALAASGLLVREIGGESVKPYQPEGLWTEKNNFSLVLRDYYQSTGKDLYRRSLYTFIRRTSPHPAMIAFDAGPRDICTVRRETTNTPLQALVLLNDPEFVEPARVMAERIQQEAGSDLNSQLILAFRLSTGRKPKAEELQILQALYHSQYEKYKTNPVKAEELLNVGEFRSGNKTNKIKTAALTIVASTMLNHDESYTKR